VSEQPEASGVEPATRSEGTAGDQTRSDKENVAKIWLRRVVIAVAVVIVAWAVYLILASFVPRWWALSIGRQVNGRLSTGILLGLIYGTVFTFLPLLVLAQAFRRALGWKIKVGLIIAAILLSIPNLMTLSIAVGRSRAALAGDVIMDVQAPGFRYASLCGAIFGAALGLAVIAVVLVLERRGDELKVLRARVEQLEAELDAAKPPLRTLVAMPQDAPAELGTGTEPVSGAQTTTPGEPPQPTPPPRNP
jgi:MFS family permease